MEEEDSSSEYSNMSKLDLSNGCASNIDTVINCIEAKKSRLSAINLSNNCIYIRGAITIIDYCVENVPTLEELSLYGNEISLDRFSEDANALDQFIESISSLLKRERFRLLDLENNPITNVNDGFILQLFKHIDIRLYRKVIF